MRANKLDRLAEIQGAAAGKAAASWAYDGNSTESAFRQTLKGIEKGDPEVMDSLPSLDLSGQWADEPTETSILAAFCTPRRLSDERRSELIEIYRSAFDSAVSDAIEKECRSHFKPHGLDLTKRYRLKKGPAVAWAIVGSEAFDGMISAVMIGDDAIHRYSASDFVELAELDYCAECGQIGCEHDGRARER